MLTLKQFFFRNKDWNEEVKLINCIKTLENEDFKQYAFLILVKFY